MIEEYRHLMCNFGSESKGKPVSMRRKKIKEPGLKREIPQTIRFNSRESSAINQYCEKFKVKNKAKFMREAIITEILKKFDEKYPTLWDDGQLRLFW